MNDPSLTRLITECRQGRRAALKAFYERFYSYALSVCLAYARDREDAREMVNDGFLKAFRKLEDLRDETTLLRWLRKIMVNTAIDYYRRSLLRPEPLNPVAYGVEEPYQNEQTMLAQFSAEEILARLQQLPAPYRLVFSLYVLEGYSHQEIAEQLKLAESTSRAYLAEANRLLRAYLTSKNNRRHERTDR